MSKNSSLWDNAMVRDAKARMSKEEIEQYKKIGEQFYKDMDFQQIDPRLDIVEAVNVVLERIRDA